MGYYVTTKRNAVLIHAITWVIRAHIMISESLIQLYQKFTVVKSIETESGIVVTKARGRLSGHLLIWGFFL